MWNCVRCFEEIDESFDVCWNCGTDRSGKIDESFETADAPSDEPIAVMQLAGAELLREPIVIHNANYGIGSVIGPALYSAWMLALALITYFRLEEKSIAAKPYLIGMFGVLFLGGCWRTADRFAQAVVSVQLGKELTVRRMFGTSQYPLSDIVAMEFGSEIRMSIPVTLVAGGRRTGELVLNDGQRIRFAVDHDLETRLRAIVKR